MSRNQDAISDNENKATNHGGDTVQADKYQPGEKGFALFLLLFGGFFLYHSLLMYAQKPGASSHAAVPLFVSSLIVVFSLTIFIIDFKKDSLNHNLQLSTILKNTFLYALPKDVIIIMVFIILYSAALFFGLGFYVSTFIFLWASMCYLMRRDYLKNVLWTVLILAFIYVMFSFAFSVVLP